MECKEYHGFVAIAFCVMPRSSATHDQRLLPAPRDPLFSPPDPARVAGALVTFEPAARTAWHTHPLGQTLIVTTGLGWVQGEGGPSRRSGQVMSCGSRLARSIGMAPRPQPPRAISRFTRS
jgi:hypothetical protein